MTGGKEWAHKIAARIEAGESVPRLSRTYAEQVLGRPILRGGKHAARPDAKDRQAGQAAEFQADEMVVL